MNNEPRHFTYDKIIELCGAVANVTTKNDIYDNVNISIKLPYEFFHQIESVLAKDSGGKKESNGVININVSNTLQITVIDESFASLSGT